MLSAVAFIKGFARFSGEGKRATDDGGGMDMPRERSFRGRSLVTVLASAELRGPPPFDSVKERWRRDPRVP